MNDIWVNVAKNVATTAGITDPGKILEIGEVLRKDVVAAKMKSRGDSLYQFFFDKAPPNSPSTEESVLSAIMDNPSVAYDEVAILSSNSFYSIPNRLIFESQLKLARDGKLTRATLCDDLRERDYKGSPALEFVGGEGRISDLEFGSTVGELRASVKVLKDFYQKRMLLSSLFDFVGKLQKSDVDKTSEVNIKLIDTLLEVSRLCYSKDLFADVPFMRAELIEHLSRLYEANKEGLSDPDKVPTFSGSLNEIIVGWNPTDLVVLAARPGMGKTAFIIADISYQVDKGKTVGMFSMEMSSKQLFERLFVYRSNDIVMDDMKKANIDDYNLSSASKTVEAIPERLYIDDEPALNVVELSSRAAKMVREYGVEIIYVDYLQLMSAVGHEGNREQAVSNMSRSLKALAKRLNVPIIALSQLSRAVEVRGGTRRPQLSDLRESGGIEQDSDIVGFIYRAEYYNITENEIGESLKGIGEVIIAKHRHGRLDTARLGFNGSKIKWHDLFEKTDIDTEEKVILDNPVIRPSRRVNDVDLEW
jgi:replicative DNA helicase